MEEEKEDTRTPQERLQEAITEQTKGTSRHNVFILEFNNIPIKKFTLEMKNQIESYPGIQLLSLINCELETLENFPNLPHLIRLDLVANNVQGKDLAYLQYSRQMQTLILSHNEIGDLKSIDSISNFNKLMYLDLFGNPVQENTEEKEYRTAIFKKIKSLTILDSEDSKGEFIEQKADSILQRVASNLLERQKPTKAQAEVIRRISSKNIAVANQAIQRKESEKNVAPPPKPKKVAATAKKTEKKQQAQPAKTSLVGARTVRQQPTQRKTTTGGKGKGKIGYQTKMSNSEKSGLTFPCGRIGRYLKEQNKSHRVSKFTKIYMSAVLEYLCAEVVELAGLAAKQSKKKRILPVHIRNALRSDEELSQYVANSIITEGGQVTTKFTPQVLSYLQGSKKSASKAE